MKFSEIYTIFLLILTFVLSAFVCIGVFASASFVLEYILAMLLAASTAYFGYHVCLVVVDAIKTFRIRRAFERTCAKCKDFEKHERGECFIEYTTGKCFATEKEKNK